MLSRILLIIFFSMLLVGCASTSPNNYAPVVDLGAEDAKQQGYYVVSQGETLYLIAWRVDMDYSQLAELNHIKPPYRLQVGQRLQLGSASPSAAAPSVIKVTPRPTVSHVAPSKAVSIKSWVWPTKGKIVGKYSASNKGINIAGTSGQAVVATATGEVVYAGNGLKAYGNLIIIKHNNHYLSAYAHNEDLTVREGAQVKQGQVIAHMGDMGTNQVMLHFEIRKDGVPVDPLHYLH